MDIEKSNETSVRKLSLFDTLSTQNNSNNESIENNVIEKNEPVFVSKDIKNEDNVSEEINLDLTKKEEFNAEEAETSVIDDDFNQETEEELLDIPTFLRRQAN